MTVTIRPATLNDLPLLSQFAPQIYRHHFAYQWISDSELDEFLEAEYAESVLMADLSDPGVCWFVAHTDSLIGFAKLTWDSVIPDTDLSGVLLNKLYLDPNATGKQHGKILFEAMVQQAREREQTFFWLTVLEQNPRARKFYEKQGMQFIKEAVFKTESQQSTLHIMGMAI